jgi:aspartate kinase
MEMTFYGAGVIHPKTIKPLQNANIPLFVKPFADAGAYGTIIKENAVISFIKPVIILKQNQALLSVSAKDYSFISESHLSEIFDLFARNQIKVNMMQTSALSFSVCFDYNTVNFNKLLNALNPNFKVKYNTGLSLITLRHYSDNWLKEITKNKTLLLEQISRNTVQLVVS